MGVRGSGHCLLDVEEGMLELWGAVNRIKTPSRYEGDELKGESSSGIRMTQVREDRSR